MSTLVVVGIDGGAASDAAADWACEWAPLAGADMRLTAVSDPTWAGIVSTPLAKAHADSIQAALDRARERCIAATPATSLRFGHVVDELVRDARTASLLVVGTNKTNGLTGVIHGTTSLKLADNIYRPLVVVPADWRHTEGPVVVGLDRETDDAAIAFAASAAETLDTTLVLLHVWQMPTLLVADEVGFREVAAELTASGTALLAETRAKVLAEQPALEVTTRLVGGEPSNEVVEAARSARLVVVGSHQRHALGGLLLGSVGHDLLMNMPCPVVIVPPVDHDRTADER